MNNTTNRRRTAKPKPAHCVDHFRFVVGCGECDKADHARRNAPHA